jgi:hypothetical protein
MSKYKFISRVILSQIERSEDRLFINPAENKINAMRYAYDNQFSFKPETIPNKKYPVNTPFQERQLEYKQRAKEKEQK